MQSTQFWSSIVLFLCTSEQLLVHAYFQIELIPRITDRRFEYRVEIGCADDASRAPIASFNGNKHTVEDDMLGEYVYFGDGSGSYKEFCPEEVYQIRVEKRNRRTQETIGDVLSFTKQMANNGQVYQIDLNQKPKPKVPEPKAALPAAVAEKIDGAAQKETVLAGFGLEVSPRIEDRRFAYRVEIECADELHGKIESFKSSGQRHIVGEDKLYAYGKVADGGSYGGPVCPDEVYTITVQTTDRAETRTFTKHIPKGQVGKIDFNQGGK